MEAFIETEKSALNELLSLSFKYYKKIEKIYINNDSLLKESNFANNNIYVHGVNLQVTVESNVGRAKMSVMWTGKLAWRFGCFYYCLPFCMGPKERLATNFYVASCVKVCHPV